MPIIATKHFKKIGLSFRDYLHFSYSFLLLSRGWFVRRYSLCYFSNYWFSLTDPCRCCTFPSFNLLKQMDFGPTGNKNHWVHSTIINYFKSNCWPTSFIAVNSTGFGFLEYLQLGSNF